MKNIEVKNQSIILVFIINGIIGKINTISTSKIRKIIVIKKNRREKGSREDLFGSNPHSKGEFFSRSYKDFFDKIEANNIITLEINKISKTLINIKNIIYINSINII